VSPPGTEENITPEGEWRSQHAEEWPTDMDDEILSPPRTPEYAGASSSGAAGGAPPGWGDASWDV